MVSATIITTVHPDGTATVTVDGVAGPRCRDITAKLEAALGTVQQSDNTDAYYQPTGHEQATAKEQQ